MRLKIKNSDTTKELEKEILFPDDFFNIRISSNLIHEIIVSTQKNRQKHWAHTKDRSKVSGGGKKPWRQKGTGRARHGSNRSPLWRGGGVTFGPNNQRVFKKKINKKANRMAIVSTLANLIKTKKVVLIEDFEINEPKTKKVLAKIGSFIDINNKDSILLIVKKATKNIKLAIRNVQKINIININDINLEVLMKSKKILVTENALKIFLEDHKDLIKD